MGFLIFLGGAVFGGCLGVGLMCCLQINRINSRGEKGQKTTRIKTGRLGVKFVKG